MDSAALRRIAAAAALYAGLALAIMLARLLPFSPGTGGVPGPDLLILMTAVWVLRRPDLLPVGAIAAVFLLADVLFQQPLGLGAAVAVVASEFLRGRVGAWREIPFVAEWAMVAGVLTVAALGYALLLALFFVDQPGLGLTLIRLILTILAYPLAAGLAGLAGLRKPLGGEAERLGRVR